MQGLAQQPVIKKSAAHGLVARFQSRSIRARPPAPTRTRAAAAARIRAAAATDADAAPAADRRGRGRKQVRKGNQEDEVDERGMPDLPQPMDYQQTLLKSFTLGGVGLHSGEYAVVRVRPAFAGEGRYFVRVPSGTNGGRFVFDGGDMTSIPFEEALQDQPPTEELEDLRVDWFQTYLTAQEEEGFVGTFSDFTQLQVAGGEMTDELREAILGIKTTEVGGFVPEVEPDLSQEPEEIVPLDPADESLVAATIASVVEAGLPFTQLGSGECRVQSVELLLAALEACGVDNARIEVEGGHEIPVLDNSALGWCLDIQVAGLRPAPPNVAASDAADEGGEVGPDAVVQKDLWAPSTAVGVQDEDGWISFFPAPFSRVTAGADHSRVAPIIGSQWYTWQADEVHFRYALAPARAFVESVEELFALRDAGFVKAGAENLFCIAAGDRWWDPSVVRMVYDEPARFKVSQMVGNLSLLSVAGSQGVPVGHVTAFNASPTLQLSFVQALMEAVKEGDVTSTNDVVQRQEEWLEQRYGGGSSAEAAADAAEDDDDEAEEDEEEGEAEDEEL